MKRFHVHVAATTRSDKYWVTDPAGVAWETFHTLGEVPVYGESPASQSGAACCTSNGVPARGEAKARAAACCG